MWIEKDEKVQKLTRNDREIILNDLKDMTGKTLRVLALAYKKLPYDESKFDELDKDKLEENLSFCWFSRNDGSTKKRS